MMYDVRFAICDLRLNHTLNHNAPAFPPSPSSPPNPAKFLASKVPSAPLRCKPHQPQNHLCRT